MGDKESQIQADPRAIHNIRYIQEFPTDLPEKKKLASGFNNLQRSKPKKKTTLKKNCHFLNVYIKYINIHKEA